MSLLFNMLSRLVITFLPRSKRLLISWLQSPSAVILEPPKIKSVTLSTVSPYDQPRQHSKTQRHYFANKGLSSQSYSFSSSGFWMWELDYKEIWAPKNWCLWTMVLEKTLESALDSKEIQPVHSKRKSVLNIYWNDWCWSWSSNTLATLCEELTH